MNARTTHVVLGSNCFSGSHMVDALLADPANRVVGISRSSEKKPLYLPYKARSNGNFAFHQLDMVRQMDDVVPLLDNLQPDYVINFAALSEVVLSNQSPVEYFDINTTAVVKLCTQLRTRSYLKRYVHVSSAEVYGHCEGPVSPWAPLNPSTPYAVSKGAADMYLLTLASNFGFPVIIIRSTNVYGRHQQLFKIIPRTVIYLRKGQKIELHGGGRAIKHFIHIRDVAQGVIDAIHRGTPGSIHHFSTSSKATVADVVRHICDFVGRDFEASTTSVEERQAQDAQYWLDGSETYETLSWRPRVSFEDGLKEVISWIDENWDEIDREPHLYQHKV